MIRSVRRARKLKGIPNINARIIDVPEDIKQMVDQRKLDTLHTRFKAYDSDSSSFIDTTELTPLLQSLGFNPTEEHVQEILSSFDTDNTGNLTFGEFIEVWAYYCQEAQSEADIIRNSFTFLLQNDSQAISFSEFRDTMLSTGNPLTEGEVRTFFSLCDDESDGILRLDEFLKVLYSQPSLDVSLTRMCDTKHDRPEVIRDVSAKCSRGRPQSSASSISARSTSRPPAAAPQLKTQLREQCAVLPVDVRPPCELSQSAQSAVSQADSLGLQSTFEALLEDSEKADYASKTTPTTNFGSTSIGHGIATESGGLKTDHSELEKIWKLKDCANTQHGGRENLAIDQQSMLTTNYGVATLCTCHGHASCGTGAGPDLIPCGSTHSSDPKFSPRETHASPGEPLLPGLTAGQPVTFSTLPSLPSEIHRKLEAMSAQTLPTLIRKGNFDSS